MSFQFTTETFIIFLGGVIGAFLKDILTDGCIELPYISGKKLSLGFLGGWMLGGFAGYFIDGSFVTAAMAGYTGSSIIQSIMASATPTPSSPAVAIPDLIKQICAEYGVDSELAIRVAKCESGLRPNAKNTNAPDSIDRGLYQINSKWHPEVSDAQAYDPTFSIRFFCQAVKNGQLNMWDASKSCWNK